jgi:hypothetical protein
VKSKQQKYTDAVERGVDTSALYALRKIDMLLGYLGTAIDEYDLGYDCLSFKIFGRDSIRIHARKKIEILVLNIIYEHMLLAVIRCKAEDRKKYAESYLSMLGEKLPEWIFYPFKDQINLNDLDYYLSLRGTEQEETGFRTPDFVRTRHNLDIILFPLILDVPIKNKQHTRARVELLKTAFGPKSTPVKQE